MGYVKNRLWYELLRLRAYHRYGHQHEYFASAAGQANIIKHGLGFQRDGTPTWWYQSLELRRNEKDDLTKAALRFVDASVAKDSRILVTGWRLTWIAQRGLRKVEGFDYLDNVVRAATEIAALAKVNVKLWGDDGFDPKLDGEYDLIMVLHWLYSAWDGQLWERAAWR